MKKLKYKCEQVRIFTNQDDSVVCFQNKLVNTVKDEEFCMWVNTETQDFRPGRWYWLEITEAEAEKGKPKYLHELWGPAYADPARK